MKILKWNEIPQERLNPLLERQAIHSERITVARLSLKKGAVVPHHSHENEQLTMLERGCLKFIFDDREVIVHAHQVLQIASHEEHAVEALEDSLAIDLFAPVREDWRTGDDAYLR